MQRKRFDQINVIPLIDILLVLLVMVVTTATFIKQGILPVELPDAKSADKKEDHKEIDVYVTKDGKYHLDKTPISVAELEKRIAEIPKDQTVVLRSDKDATFQNFVTVMDLLKKYNHEQLYIVTKE
ncbi:biopolymer transporter ExbD [Sulfurimonas sp. HSL-3221]|uniref:biopolymer transporter ExbD n=1 Tax=Sulfurimonadaceae TaxID=2771471 RepID=UPI001E448790|nr:biopolymer transporter ExbD [Sulfurimonas sp. HSL-3221]UFS61977.1 biopolymer transporter ExbD [Sulfurimonas sp. HSL-3221]